MHKGRSAKCHRIAFPAFRCDASVLGSPRIPSRRQAHKAHRMRHYAHVARKCQSLNRRPHESGDKPIDRDAETRAESRAEWTAPSARKPYRSFFGALPLFLCNTVHIRKRKIDDTISSLRPLSYPKRD